MKSRLVAMGVTVANLALGGTVKATSERAPFKAWLDACIYENRIAGFSSNVLDSLPSDAPDVRR